MVDVKGAPVKTVGIFAKPNRRCGAAQLVPELFELAACGSRDLAVRLDQQTDRCMQAQGPPDCHAAKFLLDAIWRSFWAEMARCSRQQER